MNRKLKINLMVGVIRDLHNRDLITEKQMDIAVKNVANTTVKENAIIHNKERRYQSDNESSCVLQGFNG